MKIKELEEVSDLLHEFWDFFTSNSDFDETGLQEELGEKYVKVKKYISDEFFKLHLRNELQKVRRKLK